MSVRHALLALLSEGPKYGLQLRQEFEARTGEVWPLNVGQVYTTLQRLERDGLVESDDSRGGRAAEDLPPHRRRRGGAAGLAAHAAGDDSTPPRDELVIKVLVALTVPGVDVHEVMQVHRRHLVAADAAVHASQAGRRGRRRRPGAGGRRRDLPARGRQVRWLDAADVRLKRFPVVPATDVAPAAAPARVRRAGVRR